MAHSQTGMQDIYLFVHFGGSFGSVSEIFYVLCQNIQNQSHPINLYIKALFYTRFLMLSCFNVPYQFTSLLNLHPLIFSLTSFGCFICIYVRVYFHMGIKFVIYAFLIYGHVFRNTTTV